jgi:endonuclease V-like protein UPF0215 family
MSKQLVSNTPSDQHSTVEKFVERMTSRQWKAILLAGNDYAIYNSSKYRLIAKKLGYGVLEVYKEALLT